jgi:hypothetical protein
MFEVASLWLMLVQPLYIGSVMHDIALLVSNFRYMTLSIPALEQAYEHKRFFLVALTDFMMRDLVLLFALTFSKRTRTRPDPAKW